MNIIYVLAATFSFLGLSVEPAQLVYNYSWHTRGPAIVQELARGSWTIESQTVVQNRPQPPRKIPNNSLGVDITARSAVIVDKDSGVVLWEKNKDEVRAIGSITKLMTALVFLEHNPGWDKVFAVTEIDRTVGGKQHLFLNDPITIRDLFKTSLIASDNDATMVLARASGLTSADFVQAMNQKAKDLGLANTKFVDPTGLSDANVSTASEIIKLARVAFTHEDMLNVANQDKYKFTSAGGKQYDLVSTNKLLGSFVNIVAAKTGFINIAGYCIVAEVNNDSQKILIAILGSETDGDRFQDLKMLSYWVGQNYIW